MNIDLQGKQIIVTGATSGIGRAIALQAAQAGADVAFCGLTEEGAAEVKGQIEQAGSSAFFRAVDLSDLSAARQFARDAVEALGGLDGLVNNAGTNFKKGVESAMFEDIQRCFLTNFYSAWAISQEVYPALKASGRGVVVNISSIHVSHTEKGVFPYNASKAALGALTKSMAIEWAEDNILSVAIAPGWVLTPLVQKGFQQVSDPAAEQARIDEAHLLGRMARPRDIASFAVYLLSDANGVLTGNTVIVDGAMHTLLNPL